MTSPQQPSVGAKFSTFIFGGERPVVSEEMLHEMKKEQQRKDENLMIDFITKGKSLASFNPKRIELLNIVRGSCEFFLMVLSLYCITASPFFLIYELEKSSPLFKYSVGFASGIIAFFNVFRNIISEEIDKEFGLSPMTDRKLTANLKHQFRQNLIHTILIMIFPNDIIEGIPILGSNYDPANPDIPIIIDANMFAHLVQLYKMYFIGRYFITQSMFYSHSALRVCSIYNALHDWMFVIKCRFKKRPITLLAMLMLAVIYMFAYSLYIIENQILVRSGKTANIDSFMTSVWMIVVTITTVGYGDITPRTRLGRLVVMVAATSGIILLSLMTNSLTTELLLTPDEALSYGIINKLAIAAHREHNSSSLITHLAHLSNLKKTILNKPTKLEENKLTLELAQLIVEKNKFKKMYQTLEIGTFDLEQKVCFEVASKSVAEVRVLLSAIYEEAMNQGLMGVNIRGRKFRQTPSVDTFLTRKATHAH
jgi:Ion channel